MSVRLARQSFLRYRRAPQFSLFYKLRRHIIENLRAGLLAKIKQNKCYVVLTPLSLPIGDNNQQELVTRNEASTSSEAGNPPATEEIRYANLIA